MLYILVDLQFGIHNRSQCTKRLINGNFFPKGTYSCHHHQKKYYFANFRLSIAKNCDFFIPKFQQCLGILPLHSGISYKSIGNKVPPWYNIMSALQNLSLEVKLFADFHLPEKWFFIQPPPFIELR